MTVTSLIKKMEKYYGKLNPAEKEEVKGILDKYTTEIHATAYNQGLQDAVIPTDFNEEINILE